MQILASHIAADVGLVQSTLGKESTLDKFGTSFNTLGDTLKDMFASQRTSGNKEEGRSTRGCHQSCSSTELCQ